MQVVVDKYKQVCRLCNQLADTVIWARLGENTSEHGWICRFCYNNLWNPG